MKTIDRLFALILLALISGNSVPVYAETEPNNTPETANVLLTNSTNSGTLGVSGDAEDWWKVTISSDGALIISTYSDASLEIDNYIYDQNKITQIARYLNSGTHREDTVLVLNLMPGTYYIRTLGYSGSGTYTITAKYTATQYANDTEPNDSAGAAIALAVNASATGHLGFFGNGFQDRSDWRKIVLPADGKLVAATYSDPTIEIDNAIFDQDKTTVIAGYKYGGAHREDTTEALNLAAGTYYLRTYNYNAGYGSYTINSIFTPSPLANDAEPNDVIAQAKTLFLDTRATGHLGYYKAGVTDGYDYYAITLPSAADTVFVRTDSNPELEIDLHLVTAEGTALAHGTVYGTVEVMAAPKLPAGTYYIQVQRWSGYGAYNLIASTVRPSGQTVGVEKSAAGGPVEFSLSQNFPNPFNPSTKILYSIVAPGAVQLAVYDRLGREVAVLVDEVKQPGAYSADWNAGRLPSGVYVCRLHTENFSAVKKMVLQK